MFLANFFKPVDMGVLKNGLIIMLFGLIGVFSVIILLYIVTKLLGSIKTKKNDNDE